MKANHLNYDIDNKKGVIHCVYERLKDNNHDMLNFSLDLCVNNKYGDTRFGLENIEDKNAYVHWSEIGLIKINKNNVVKEPELSKEYVDYISGYDEDVDVHIKMNGNKLEKVTVADGYEKKLSLIEGKDYLITYDGSDDYIVKIKETTLEHLLNNQLLKFKFSFTNKFEKTLTLSELYPMFLQGHTLSIGGGEGKYDDTLTSIISLNVDPNMDINDEEFCHYLKSYSMDINYSPDEVIPYDVIPLFMKEEGDNDVLISSEKGKIHIECNNEKIFKKNNIKLVKLTFKNNKGKKEAASRINVSCEMDLDGKRVSATGISGKVKFKEFNPYSEVRVPELFIIEEGLDGKTNTILEKDLPYAYNEKDVTVCFSAGNTIVNLEGIDGLLEGEDYTVEEGKVVIKASALFKFRESGIHYFTLRFNNGTKKVLPVNYNGVTIPEHFNVYIGEKDRRTVYRNNLIMVPVKVRNNVGDILTKCDFNLKYDTDMFKDAYVICYDNKVKSTVYSENGIVNITYDKQDPSLSPQTSYDPIYGNQINLYLALQVRDDTVFGDTVVKFEENSPFVIRNDLNGTVVTTESIISINPLKEDEEYNE